MIPAGYMYKSITQADDRAPIADLIDYFSVGTCGAGISPFFTDYIPLWKHNGYWLFDSPEIMNEVAKQKGIDLSKMTLFYYEFYEFEFAEPSGEGATELVPFEPERSFPTLIRIPENKILVGYDVVEYASRNAPECSLLSCSGLAQYFELNSHCLFETFEQAMQSVESGRFHAMEPGPYRILAVYLCD